MRAPEREPFWSHRADMGKFWIILGIFVGIAISFSIGVIEQGAIVLALLIIGLEIFSFVKSDPKRLTNENFSPKVCVVICAHNEEKVIHRSLRSSLNQDYKNLRIVLVDDASSDRTLEFAKEVAKEDEKVFFLKNEKNLGKFRSMMRAVENTDAEVYFFIDADNEIPRNYVGNYVKLMEKVDAMETPLAAYNQSDSFTSLLHNAEITALSFVRFSNLFPSFTGRGMVVKRKVLEFIREKKIEGVDDGAVMNSAVELGKFRYFFPRGPVLREMATTTFQEFLKQRDRWYTLGMYEAMKNGAKSVLFAFGFSSGFVSGTIAFSFSGVAHSLVLPSFVFIAFVFGVILHYMFGLGKNPVQGGMSAVVLIFLNAYLVSISMVKAIFGKVPRKWYKVERS